MYYYMQVEKKFISKVESLHLNSCPTGGSSKAAIVMSWKWYYYPPKCSFGKSYFYYITQNI